MVVTKEHARHLATVDHELAVELGLMQPQLRCEREDRIARGKVATLVIGFVRGYREHLSQFIEGSTPQTLRERRPLEAIPPFSFSIWLERVLRIVLTPLFGYRSQWIAHPNEPPCDFSVALAHGFSSFAASRSACR
jgi:hypothetical protein